MFRPESMDRPGDDKGRKCDKGNDDTPKVERTR